MLSSWEPVVPAGGGGVACRFQFVPSQCSAISTDSPPANVSPTAVQDRAVAQDSQPGISGRGLIAALQRVPFQNCETACAVPGFSSVPITMQLSAGKQDTRLSGSDDTPVGVGGETVCHWCGTRGAAGDPEAIAPGADIASQVATATAEVTAMRNRLRIVVLLGSGPSPLRASQRTPAALRWLSSS
jgi:hypothetical protein